jgi:hypothetical protein
MPLADVGGDTGHDIPSRAEVEKILNDPNIDRDTKRELALNYIDYIEDETPESCGFASEDERNRFRDYIKSMNGDWITESDIGDNTAYLEDVQAAYKTAHEKYDANQAAGRQGDRDALNKDAAKTQEIAGRATETDPGCANSNDIMVPGLSGFKVYEIFHPLYVRALSLAGGGAAVSLGELQRLYHEQDNIPFNLFKASADELAAVGTAITGSAQDVSGKLGNSLGTWEGAAADQARAYQKAYSDKTNLVAEAFKAAADGLMRTNASVGKFCREKVEWLQKWYTDNIDGATAQDIERIIRIADGSCSQNDIIHCIKFLSIEAKNAFNDDGGDIDQSTIDEVLKPQAVAWLKNVFLGWFGKHIENFQLVCKNTRDAINGAWKAYSDSLGQVVENPYADLGKTPETGGEKPVEKGGGGKDTGGGGPSSGGGGPSSGGGGPSSGGGQKPPPSAVEYMQPEKPEVPEQEKNPVTDKPLDVDPATGQPYPIDPRTGEAIKDGTRPETMTVEQGDRKISMAEPGADGKMDISVQDGTGQAKDYNLDFGDGKATPGTGDAAGGPVHRDTGERLDQQPASRPLSSPGQVHQPGPDGKIHIEDGGLKITAERPDGPGGPTLVTVDDGSGHPAKYTIGEDEPAGGRHASTDPAPQAAGRYAAEGAPARPVEEAARQHVGQDVRQHDATSGGVGGGAPASVPAETAHQPEPVAAAAVDSDSESTTAQSLSNPFDENDDALGDTSDPAGSGGGATAPSAPPGLGSAPGGGAQDPAAAGAGMMGGMGMMGGGAPGGGQGSGEDQQRTSSGYRVDGGLFDTATSTGSRISGSLDDDGVIGFR